MITLDLDISYLCSRYNIGYSDIQRYRRSNLSIEQIMEIEAKQGNQAATKLLMQITNNPEELSRLFQLVNPMNRYLILTNMNHEDLLMIMQFLEPDEMILGLSIFNEDVLIELMMKMEPEALAKVVLSQMDAEKFLKLIPEDFLNQFLSSDKLNRDMLMAAMENIDEEQLQKMMEAYTGQSCYESRDNILSQISQFEDDEFMNAVFMMEAEGKQQLISNLLHEKPELFEEFSAEAMVFPFRKMKKEEVLKSLTVLDTKEMLPMVEQMPCEILSLIATQIDPKAFSEILCKDFSNVIAQCGLKL